MILAHAVAVKNTRIVAVKTYNPKEKYDRFF